MELEARLDAKELHHFTAGVDIMLVFVTKEQSLLVIPEQVVVFLKFKLIHRINIVTDLLINIFFDCCPTVRHHVLRLVFAKIEVH